jgi:hypothetical protein
MHGTHQRPKRRSLRAFLAGLLRRRRGMHNAPRGGDPFPTGPMDRYAPDPYARMARKDQPPLPRGARYHPYRSNDLTMVDLPAVSARPYVDVSR